MRTGWKVDVRAFEMEILENQPLVFCQANTWNNTLLKMFNFAYNSVNNCLYIDVSADE